MQLRVAPVDLKPLVYVHIPKCGSSFATVVAHYACGDRVPADLTVREPGGAYGWSSTETTERWNAYCPQAGTPALASFANGHAPLSPDVDPRHAVAMFREPRTRVLSGYFHYTPELDAETGGSGRLHDCPRMRSRYCLGDSCDGDKVTDSGRRVTNPAVVPLDEYGACVGACMTNMLNGRGCGDPQRADGDIAAARAKVRRFGFVGLTEEWDLSVCLWHAMFGGRCTSSEFADLRPGPKRDGYGEHHEELRAWDLVTSPPWLAAEAPPDEDVYKEAKAVFWERVQAYNVSRPACLANSDASARKFFEATTGDALTVLQTNTTYDWPGRYHYTDDPR